MRIFDPIWLWFLLGILAPLSTALALYLRARRSPHRVRSLALQDRITCLLCGRRNRIGAEEWERSRVVCRCGQPLYIATPPSTQEHPPRR